MGKIGYHFSSEENRANRLVDLAKRAEDAGFTFGFISDHFHQFK